LISQNNRLNGNYYLSLGANFEEYILSLNNTFLGNCVNDIFTSGREKRNYSSKERGVPFLSNTDISSKNPFCSCNYMNSKHIGTKAVISNNMLLTGRVGQDTVGQVYFPHKFLIGSVASDNVIRIVVNDQIPKEYLFAFLSTEVGKEIIRRRKTGVGQPFITEEMLLSIPIPILDKNKILKIKNQICQYSFLIDTSFNIERQAIQLIEKEIDQWQN
jgi:type I restriction enzyme S subunit